MKKIKNILKNFKFKNLKINWNQRKKTILIYFILLSLLDLSSELTDFLHSFFIQHPIVEKILTVSFAIIYIFLLLNLFIYLLTNAKSSFLTSLSLFNLKKFYKVFLSILILFVFFSLSFTVSLRMLLPLMSYTDNSILQTYIFTFSIAFFFTFTYLLFIYFLSPWIALIEENLTMKEILKKSAELSKKHWVLTSVLIIGLIAISFIFKNYILDYFFLGVIKINLSHLRLDDYILIPLFLALLFLYNVFYFAVYYNFLNVCYQKITKN